MSDKPENPSVFPKFMDVYGDGIMQKYRESQGGLSLLDLFAIAALQVIYAPNCKYLSEDEMADSAYELADAMLYARKKISSEGRS